MRSFVFVVLAISVVFISVSEAADRNGCPFGFCANPVFTRSDAPANASPRSATSDRVIFRQTTASANHYRENPTYNHPRGYDGTTQGAQTSESWAQAEERWAQTEQQRASAAQGWASVDQQYASIERERTYTDMEMMRTVVEVQERRSVINPRAAQEWMRAAREGASALEDISYTVRNVADAFRGNRW